MNKKQLTTISKKLDLTLKAISIMPLFIASIHDKNPNRMWKDAIKEWEKIDKEYTKLLKHEHNNNTPGIENTIS